MAEVIKTNIDVAINTSKAAAELKKLQTQINAFNLTLNRGSVDQLDASKRWASGLADVINNTKFFRAETVKMQTSAGALDSVLKRGSATMGQFFSAAFNRRGTMFAETTALASERVRTLQTQFIATSKASGGMQEALAIRPLAAFSSQASIAAQRMTILSAMFKQGTTNLINFGKNVQWAGRQLMVGFTVPLTIFGTAATKVFRDLEKEVVNFKKVYGDLFTTDLEVETNLNAVKELSKEFTKYGIAAKETMMLAAIGAQAGKEGAELQAATIQATRLSVLGDIDRQTAMKTTIALQSAFKLSNEELANSINFLNLVENSSVVSLQNLTDAIPRVAPIIVGLGGDIKDMAVFLAAMQEGGVNAAEAANGLKSSLGRLISPTKQAKDMANEFGISLERIVEVNEGDVLGMVISLSKAMEQLTDLQKQQLLSAVFGKFQFARMGALFENITREGSQASRIIEMMDTSIEDLAATSDKELGAIENSLGTQLTAAIEKFKLELAPIGELFTKMAIPLLNFATKVLESFNSISDSRKTMLAWVGMIVGIAVPALTMFFGLITNLIGNMSKFGQLLLGFAVNFARKGPLGAIKSLTQSTKYLSLAEIDAANAARQLGSATEITNAALLKQVSAATPATAAINALTASYKLLAAEQARAVATQPALFATGSAIVGRRLPIVKRNKGGEIFTLNDGNRVPGVGNTDTVPAMLTPGEFVVNKESTQNNLDILKAINSGTPMNLGGQMKGGILHAMAGAVARSFGAKRVSNFISAETGPFANKSRNTIRRSQSSRTASKHNVPPGQIIGKKDNFVYGFEPLTNQQLKGTAIYKEAGFDRMGVPAAQIKKEMLSKDGMFFIDSYAGGPWNQAGYTKAISNKIDAIVANNPGKEIRFLDKKGLGRVLNNPGLKTDPRYKDIKFLSVADIHDRNVLSYLKPDHLTKLRKVETQTQMLARGRSREYTAGTPMFESINMLPSNYPAGTTVRVGDQITGAHLYQYTGEKWTRVQKIKPRATDMSIGPDSYHRWSKGIKNWRGEKRPEGIHASHVFNAGGMVPIQKFFIGGIAKRARDATLQASYKQKTWKVRGGSNKAIIDQYIQSLPSNKRNNAARILSEYSDSITRSSARTAKTMEPKHYLGSVLNKRLAKEGIPSIKDFYKGLETKTHATHLTRAKLSGGKRYVSRYTAEYDALSNLQANQGSLSVKDFIRRNLSGKNKRYGKYDSIINASINPRPTGEKRRKIEDQIDKAIKDRLKNYKGMNISDNPIKGAITFEKEIKPVIDEVIKFSGGSEKALRELSKKDVLRRNKGGAIPGGVVNTKRNFYGYVSRIVAEKFSQGLYHAGNIKGPLAAKGRGTRGPGLYTTESQQAATMFKDRLNQPNLYQLGFSDDQIKMIQEGKVRMYDHSNPIHRRKLAEELGFKAESKNPNDVYFTKKGVPDVNDINLFNSIESGALKKLGYDVGMFPLGYSRPQKGSYVTSSKSETYTGVRRKRKDYFKVNSMPEQQYYDQTRSWTNKFETGSNEIIFVTDKVVPSKVAPKTQSIRLNKGNIVPGVGNTDTVPAMLTPGEFVINKESTKQNYDLLTAINNGMNMGGKVKGYNKGGTATGIQYFDDGGEAKKAARSARIGQAGMMGSMGLLFLPMMAEPLQKSSNELTRSFGKLVDQNQGMIMATAILTPILLGLGLKLGLLLGGIAAMGFVAWKLVGNFKEMRNASSNFIKAMYGSADITKKFAEEFNRQTVSQRLATRQAEIAGGEIEDEVIEGAAQFIKTDLGKELIKEMQTVAAAGGDVAEALRNQLARQVVAEIMTPEEARAIAAQVGAAMGDETISFKASAQITKLFGTDGKAINKNLGNIIAEISPKVDEDLLRIQAENAFEKSTSGFGKLLKPFLDRESQVYQTQLKGMAQVALETASIEKEARASITLALQENTITADQYLQKLKEIDGAKLGGLQQYLDFAGLPDLIKERERLEKIGPLSLEDFNYQDRRGRKPGQLPGDIGIENVAIGAFDSIVRPEKFAAEFEGIIPQRTIEASTNKKQIDEKLKPYVELLDGQISQIFESQGLENTKEKFNENLSQLFAGKDIDMQMAKFKDLIASGSVDFGVLMNLYAADSEDLKEVRQRFQAYGTDLETYFSTLQKIPDVQTKDAIIDMSMKQGGRVLTTQELEKVTKDVLAITELPQEVRTAINVEKNMSDLDAVDRAAQSAPKVKKLYEDINKFIKKNNKDLSNPQVRLDMIAEFAGENADIVKMIIANLGEDFDETTLPLLISTTFDNNTKALLGLRNQGGAFLENPNSLVNQRRREYENRFKKSNNEDSNIVSTGDGDGQKSLFQRLKEEEKLAKDFVKSMGRLASITGVGSLGFIEKIVGEGEEGLKLLKSGGKKLKAAFDAYRNTIIQGVKFELNVSVPRQIKELNELEKTRTDLINQGLIPAAAKELDMEYLLFLSREKNSKEIKKYIKNLNDLYNAKNRKTGDEALLETLNSQNSALNYQVDLQERRLRSSQNQITEIQEQNEEYSHQIDLYNKGLEKIAEEEEKINEQYNLRIEALNKVQKANERAANLSKQQVDLASALASGDIAAAAKISQDITATRAQYRLEDARNALEEQRQKRIESLTISVNKQLLTRKQIENEIKTINDKIWENNLNIYDIRKSMEPVENEILRLQREQLAVQDAIADAQERQRVAAQNTSSGGATGGGTSGGGSTSGTSSEGGAKYQKIKGVIKKQLKGATRTAALNDLQRFFATGNAISDKEYNLLIDRYKLKLAKLMYGGVAYKGSRQAPPSLKMAYGSIVPGIGLRDKVPALLTPGEFVVRKSAAQAYMPLLESINSDVFPRVNFNGAMPKGSANNNSSMYNNYSVNVNVSGTNASPDDIANAVMEKIKRIESRNIRSAKYLG